MGAHGDALFPGNAKSAGHDLRITTVKATGDIGACDDVEHRRIIAHDIGAKTFATVAIEIYASHGLVPAASKEQRP